MDKLKQYIQKNSNTIIYCGKRVILIMAWIFKETRQDRTEWSFLKMHDRTEGWNKLKTLLNLEPTR
jgi:hypothetical protein